MEKLLIISDSHGLTDELIKLCRSHRDYKILHLGDFCINEKTLNDLNICYVKGNCDFSRADSEKLLEINGKKIFMTHGNKYNVKSSIMNLYYKALELNVDYCLFGHTHHELMCIEDGITFLNPGSLKDTGSYIEIVEGKVSFKRM